MPLGDCLGFTSWFVLALQCLKRTSAIAFHQIETLPKRNLNQDPHIQWCPGFLKRGFLGRGGHADLTSMVLVSSADPRGLQKQNGGSTCFGVGFRGVGWGVLGLGDCGGGFEGFGPSGLGDLPEAPRRLSWCWRRRPSPRRGFQHFLLRFGLA